MKMMLIDLLIYYYSRPHTDLVMLYLCCVVVFYLCYFKTDFLKNVPHNTVYSEIDCVLWGVHVFPLKKFGVKKQFLRLQTQSRH